MKCLFVALLTAVCAATPLHTASAQTAPTLGRAQSYAVLAGTPKITNTGITQVNGDLGIHPAALITDAGTLTVNGAIHTADAAALGAKNDLLTAYNFLDSSLSNPCNFNFIVPTDIGGAVLLPGVYCFSSSAALTGPIPTTLLGGPSDVWVFKTVSALTVGPGSSMVFSTGTVSGGQACNVFWKIGSSASLDTTAKFIGSMLALTSITINTGAIVDGRALARNGTVTMDHNTITAPFCSAEAPPTLSKAFSPTTINPGGPSTLTITLGNSTGTVKTLTAALTDNLSGIGVTATGGASTTCGGVVSIAAGVVSLPTGTTIPAGGCTVKVPVTATVAGAHVNLTSSLMTNHGEAPSAGATLTVRSPVIVPAVPTLLIDKKASSTTYDHLGQVITYTYTVTNTGDVALTGPFTVTDDKLGSISCGSEIIYAKGAAATCQATYTVKAIDICGPSLPHGVVAKINTGPWLGFTNSTQDTKITGAGPSLPDGTYPCWCIQDHVPLDLHNQNGKLFSTVGGALPSNIPSMAWDKVNYVLNHKTKGVGNNLTFLKDVQTAIWVLLGETNPEFGRSANANAMINAANTNGVGFVPAGKTAVIINSDGIANNRKPRPGEIQESICEVTCTKTIVNKATASVTYNGRTWRSNTDSVTVSAK